MVDSTSGVVCCPGHTINSIKLRLWTCEDDDTAYVMSSAKLPSTARVNLDDVAKGAAKGVDGKLVMNKRVTYAGVPARDIRVESTYHGKPATAFGRVLVRERILYQLLVVEVGETTTKPPAHFSEILASLSFR